MNANDTVERLGQLRRVVLAQGKAQRDFKVCKIDGVSKDFDMRHWDCGTAACALGSAGWDPWFRARGLKTKEGKLHESDNKAGHGLVLYKGKKGHEAGALFFGLTLAEADDLFRLAGYRYSVTAKDITPGQVIEKIDKLVADYKQRAST